MMMKFSSVPGVLTLVACTLLWTGCTGKTDGAAPAPATAASGPAAGASAPAGPAVGVTTVRAQQRDLQVLITGTGTVVPLTSVDVKPQVTSVVSRVHVKEGQNVRAGDLLFTLDSRIDETNVAKAKAQLARDEAALADAQRQLARSRDLLTRNFVSQGAVDTSQAAVDSQSAAVAADRAALDGVRVALSYARITAPSAGRVGAINVFTGSSVQANQTTLITITQLDPIAVAFNLPQRDLGDALRALKGGGSLVGRLQFVDNAVDSNSGTVKVKAQFSNREGKLWPGAFVNVAMTSRTLKDAIVVPQAAVILNARGAIVYAVQGNSAVARPVKLVYSQGEDAAVSGINAGERIVVDGRQNLRPGVTVAERAPAAPGRPASKASGAVAARAGASAP